MKTYTHQKSFAPLTLISLSLKLQIPVLESRKIIGSSSNCQILFIVTVTFVSVKANVVLRDRNMFVQKKHFDPKMQNSNNNVFR